MDQYPRSVAENACNFTSSCSWRRWFNNNNNSKQCCFKNQRWQNNPFSSKSKQKSGHLVPVSEWWVWLCLSLGTFLPTVPCQRSPLSLARVSVGLDRFFIFYFFAAEYSGTRNRTRVVVNRAGTRAFDYPLQPYKISSQCAWLIYKMFKRFYKLVYATAFILQVLLNDLNFSEMSKDNITNYSIIYTTWNY